MTSSHISNHCEPDLRRSTTRAVFITVRLALAAIAVALGTFGRAAVADPDARPAVFAGWEVLTRADGLPDDSIRAITIAADEVWIGTDHGIGVRNDGAQRVREVEFEPREFPVSAIAIDPTSQDVWIATLGSGLLRLTGGRCDRFDQRNSGLAGDIVFAVAMLGDEVYVATNGGLSAYDLRRDEWDISFARRRSMNAEFVRWVVDFDFGLLAVSRRGMLHRWRLQHYFPHGDWEIVADRLDVSGGEPLSPEKGYISGIAAAKRQACCLMPGRSSVACLSRLQGAPQLDLIPFARFGHDSDAGCATTLTTHGEEVWVAGERFVTRLLGSDARVDYDFLPGAGGIRVQHVVDGRVVGTTTIPHELPAGRIRCLAAGARDLWIGTTHGLIHATQPGNWPSATNRVADPAGVGKARDDGIVPLPGTGSARVFSDTAPTIAIYGPRNRMMAFPLDDPPPATVEARPDARAVTHVLDAGNAARAHRGLRPIEVVSMTPGYDRYGWGLPEDDLVRLAIRPDVAGILGDAGEQGAFTDATIEAMEVVWLDVSASVRPALTQPSRNRWVFQCHGDLPRQHRLMVEHVTRELERRRLAVVRDDTGDGDRFADWWIDHANKIGMSVIADIRLPSRQAGNQDAVPSALERANPDAVLTWSSAERAAEILRAIRRAGSTAAFVGGPQLRSEKFTEAAREVGGMILALVPADWPSDSAAMAAFGMSADTPRGRVAGGPAGALQMSRSLFATEHLLKAMETAGTDRDRVRSMLEAMERSATGEAHAEERLPTARATIAVWTGDAWRVEEIGDP